MINELRANDENWLAAWGENWVLEGCTHCNGVFVLPPEKVSQHCPACGRSTLAQMDPEDERPVYTQPPELMVPFQANKDKLRSSVAQFIRGLWLAPTDLNEAVLLGRLQPVYLPMWLVDVQVQGEWQAEMGFDYEIVSHREQYKNSNWQTERVKETRIRWEQRVGRLNRQYDNRIAPALEEQADIEAKVGRFPLQAQKPFQATALSGSIVRLPNRPPEDAWNDVVPILQASVSKDCCQASEADHTRGFRWSPNFDNKVWTQMLLPLYTSYYLDDDNKAQMVLIHGQSGKLHGVRRASMKRARRVAAVIAAVTAVFLVLTLALILLGSTVAEAALAWAGVTGVLTLGAGGTAVLPLLYAWYVNTFQSPNN